MEKNILTPAERAKAASYIRSGLIRDLHQQHIITDKQFEMLIEKMYTFI